LNFKSRQRDHNSPPENIDINIANISWSK